MAPKMGSFAFRRAISDGSQIDMPLEASFLFVSFSPDGRLVVCGSGDGTLSLWGSQSGSQIREPFRAHPEGADCFSFSCDGR